MSAGLLPVVLVPAGTGALCLLCGARRGGAGARAAGLLLVAGMALNLAAVVAVFRRPLALDVPLGGLELVLRFRLDALSSFIALAAAVLGLLIALYAARFMLDRAHAAAFFGCFAFTVASVNGAVLADHLLTLLVFWEAMLAALWVLIAVGGERAHAAASKALFISGATDLCLMAGAGLVLRQAHTLTLSQVHLGTQGLSGVAFVLLAVGATSKAGAMPFHGWIPDAAEVAPAPFMALVPGVLEKLLGVYFLARLGLDLFAVGSGWASTLLMCTGATTIVLAVLMALVQRDYQRLLSFHAISQVGYMILGLGTGVPAGVVGGLFHMVNHALYKSALFLTGGAVQRQAGTTDLRRLGGLAARMPITFACFAVAALAISGVPPLNGFYSKELVYEGALARGWGWYAAAALGSFFTAASFLKLGHAAFLGAFRAPRPRAAVVEAPAAMLAPMIAIAALCLAFGVGNALPLRGLVVPALAGHLPPGLHLGGLVPPALAVAAATIALQVAAVLHHRYGVRRSGSALGAADHLHDAPVARQLYAAAERGRLDPYLLAVGLLGRLALAGAAVDRAVDRAVAGASVRVALAASAAVRRAHTGRHARYLAWSVAGLAAIVAYLMGGF